MIELQKQMCLALLVHYCLPETQPSLTLRALHLFSVEGDEQDPSSHNELDDFVLFTAKPDPFISYIF